MSQEFTGTITRRSNGAIEFTPSDAGTFPKLPSMGDEVTLSIEVTRTAVEIERDTAAAKQARAALAADVDAEPAAASAPAAERRARK